MKIILAIFTEKHKILINIKNIILIKTMKLNEIKGGIYFDTSHKKNYYILENNLFDFRTINLKSNINHLLKIIIRQNQLKQTNLKDIDKATDILYLSINFN